jgi:excisionase family DNA binding protein
MAGDESALISVQETARLWAVSEMTVYRAIEAGQLPAARIRRSWRIRRVDAERMATPQPSSPRPAQSPSPSVTRVAPEMETIAAPEEPAGRIRIFKNRPWETETTPAVPSAAGRARSASKKKAASQRH